MNSAVLTNFAPFEERMRAENLPGIVIDNFRYYYETFAAGSEGLIGEGDIAPVEAVPDIADLTPYSEAGRAALSKAAVLKLNGGLGTSMGLDRAKSLLVVREQLTFLDIIARQNIAFHERYGSHVPLLLMNSFNTDADSRAVLAQYPQLESAVPLTMMQHKVPKILQDSLEPAEWPANPALEWCPPGHGEVYITLATSGMLDSLLAHGYEYLFISNVDNLGASLDMTILGYVAQHNVPFLMEVAHRTEADKKGGHIAQLHNGQLILREVAQCPEEDLPEFQNVTKYRYFNTNNIWLNLLALKRLLVQHNNVIKLPMIRNNKTVDPKDSRSPAVVQLETAMGAAIAVFEGARVLSVGRDRFMPVKTCSDLLSLRSDIYQLDAESRLRVNPSRTLGPITISLDSNYKLINDFEARFPEGAPSLVECARLVVEGDMVFETPVTFAGNVRVTNRSAQQARVVAGTSVADTQLDISQ